jgi:hypothetical protein
MITDKDNVVLSKPKFWSKQYRKTPVVILMLILGSFTVMGWFYAVEKLSQYNEANMQVINVTVVKK